MINATPASPIPSFTPTNSNVVTPPPVAPSNPREPMMKPVVKKKMNWRIILGALVLLFLVVGASAGFYLSQQSQEIRQQASVAQPPDTGDPTSVCVECCVNGTTRRECRANTQLARDACGGTAGACVVHNTDPLVCSPGTVECQMQASGTNKQRKCVDNGSGWVFTGNDSACNTTPQASCPSGYTESNPTCTGSQFKQTAVTNGKTCYRCVNKTNCYDLTNGCKVAAIDSTACENKTKYFNTQADCLAKTAVSTFLAAGEKCTSASGCQCTSGPDSGKKIANGATCAVKVCYTTTDGCTAAITAANKVTCNGTTEFDTKVLCQDHGGTPTCNSSLNRPDGCSCSSNPQCNSQLCQIDSINPAGGVCKANAPTCNSTTNRPDGCSCSTNPQCASGVCNIDSINPSGGKCGPTTSACIQKLGSLVAYNNAKSACQNGTSGTWNETTCTCGASTTCSSLNGTWKSLSCSTGTTAYPTSSTLSDYGEHPGQMCCTVNENISCPTGYSTDTRIATSCLQTPLSTTLANGTKCYKCPTTTGDGDSGYGACNSGLPHGYYGMVSLGNYQVKLFNGWPSLEAFGFKCNNDEWGNNRCLVNEFWSGSSAGGSVVDLKPMMTDPDRCWYQFDFNYPGLPHYQGNPAAVTICYCPNNPNPPTPPPTNPPPPVFQCNTPCSTDTECKGADSRFVCHTVSEGNKRCRLADNLSSDRCQPAAPQCLSIKLNNVSNPTAGTADPKIGENITLTCGEVSGAQRYIFLITEPDGELATPSATGRVSAQYTITKTGKHYAQCQICTGAASTSCLPFEPRGNN